MDKDIYGFSLVSHEMSPTGYCVRNDCLCLKCTGLVSPGCVEDLRLRPQRRKVSADKMEREKRCFFFTLRFSTLSDSISRSIGVSEVTRREISPILGFLRNSIFKPPEICGHITSFSFGQITPLCDSGKSETVEAICSLHWLTKKLISKSQLCQLQESIHFALF